MTRTEVRWVLLPLKVILAFVLVGIAAGLISERLYIWWEPFAGFFAAIAVVSVAYICAPGRKLLVALAAFVLGGAIAYQMLKDSYFPEGYARAYEPTLMPFWLTLGGGLLALATVAVHAFVKRRSPSNTSLEHAREI
jgi:hypothetical protein